MALQFLLTATMHEAGKVELLNVIEAESRWHYTFSDVGEALSKAPWLTGHSKTMGKSGKHPTSIRHYSVDEAGGGTLFNRRGRIIVGTEGRSRFLILGFLDVANPDALPHEGEVLR